MRLILLCLQLCSFPFDSPLYTGNREVVRNAA